MTQSGRTEIGGSARREHGASLGNHGELRLG